MALPGQGKHPSWNPLLLFFFNLAGNVKDNTEKKKAIFHLKLHCFEVFSP